MKRRGFLGMLAGAVVAASMEIGWKLPTSKERNIYDWKYQLECMVKNMEANIMDIWEDRHAEFYFAQSGHKVILESNPHEANSPI